MLNARTRGIIFLSLASGIWGGVYVVSRVILDFVPPTSLMFIRYSIALLILLPIILYGKSRKQLLSMKLRDWLIVAVMGVCGYFLSIWCQFAGTSASDAHTASLITASTPVFALLAGKFILKEQITWLKTLAVVLCLVGILVISGIGTGLNANIAGIGILALAAIFWALLTVFARLAARTMSSLTSTTLAILIAWIASTPFAISDSLHGGMIRGGDWTVWLGLAYIGILSTAIAFFLWNKGFESVDAGIGSLFLFVQTLVGTLLGCLLLSEQLSFNFIIGSLFVLGGIFIATRNQKTKVP